MLRSLHISSLYFYCLLFLCSSVLTQTFQCDQASRENPNCLTQDAEETCAFYTQDCPLEACGKIVFNGCTACTFPEVIYYEKKACESNVLIKHCPTDFCSDSFKHASYNPVCGVKRDEQQGIVQRTVFNDCLLCEGGEFYYYYEGPCQEERTYCKDPQPSDSPNDPVCASFVSEDFGRVYINVSSSSEACKDEAIEFWTKGVCGPFGDARIYCLPNDRPEECTEGYYPVCGFYKEYDGLFAHNILDNECFACSAPSIVYYTPGPCAFSCNPADKVDICSARFDPVCGAYEENGETKSVSLRNPCTACSYFDKPLSTYAEGLCPGGEGINCVNDAGADAVGTLNPVCAYFTQDCNDNSCRKTYPESIFACADSKTIWYMPGICPGDPGVSCENYRTRSVGGQQVYPNVCGLAFKECFEKVCVSNYDDQYAACETVNVDFFKEGPC